jgi:hypothetical protein
VLILNLVKVLCFDTLLQVLILKVVKAAGFVIFAILRKWRQIGIFTPTGSGQAQRPACRTGRHRAGGHPPPGCFGKRGCKLLKTKDGSRKKKVKRLQAIDKTRVRGGTAGGVREVSSR